MTTSVISPASLAAHRRSWTTPQILWRTVWALWLADVLVLCAFLVAGHIHYTALSAIGKDSAPSIIASQAIKSALSDMDADAANGLLAEPGFGETSLKAYRTRRQEAATALISAAQNITYGDSERRPILQIQLGLGTYESLIQRARDLQEEHSPAFLSVYNQAAQLLDSNILPAADALDRANLQQLDNAYSDQRSKSLLTTTLAGLACMLLLAILGSIQLFLISRTRRLINIPLFAASLLLLFFGAFTLRALSNAESNLRRAKVDAFISIHALWRARAVAYAANADESRFLLDSERGQELTDAFFAKRDLLAKLPQGETYESAARGALSAHSFPEFTGYLADELNNITFPGEREAAAETLRTFGRYVALDSRIRDLERSGKHREAIALCTGTSAGQSDWAFEQFDTALGRTLKINQDAFDTSVATGFATLKHFDVKVSIVAALTAILCLLGLLQRIREYQ